MLINFELNLSHFLRCHTGYEITSISPNSTNSDKKVKITKGSLEEFEVLKTAMSGSDAVFFTVPLNFDPQAVKLMIENIVNSAKTNGIKKIIYNSGIPLGDTKTGYAAIDLKRDAFEILSQSGLDVVTLMPTVYLENLSSPFLLPVINAQSVIPYPIASDFKFSWVSYENFGRYVAAALKTEDLNGKKILATNRDEVTAPSLAEQISSSAQKTLQFFSISADDFEKNLEPILGEVVAKEISNLYRGIDENRDIFQRYYHEDFVNSVNLQSTTEWARSIAW